MGQAGMGQGGVSCSRCSGSYEEIGAFPRPGISYVVVGPHGIKQPGIRTTESIEIVFHPVVAAPDLVAVRKHHKRRMVPVFDQHSQSFFA